MSLDTLASRIRQGAADGLRKAEPVVVKDANSITPVRTGYLRSRNRPSRVTIHNGKVSGGIENAMWKTDSRYSSKQRKTAKRTVKAYHNGNPYNRYVHEGTRYMRPRPFLRDAVLQNKDEIMQSIVAGINSRIRG